MILEDGNRDVNLQLITQPPLLLELVHIGVKTAVPWII